MRSSGPSVSERCESADRAARGAPAVELHGITKRFPGVVANHDINIRVRPGEVHAIVGENGAGKSTLMKILYGMQRPDEGTIRVDGQRGPLPVAEGRHRRRHRHGAPALHAGRQPHRPGERDPRLRADARAGARHRPARAAGSASCPTPTGCRSTRTAGRGPRRRRAPAGRDHQGPLPGRPHPDPRRADRGARARRRSTSCSATSGSSKRQGVTVIFISHKLDEVLADRRRDHRDPRAGRPWPRSTRARSTAGQLAELMVGSELPAPGDRASRRSPTTSSSSVARPRRSRIDERPHAARRRHLRHPPGRDRRHRRRRGQRPGRAGRGAHRACSRRPPGAIAARRPATSPRGATRKRRGGRHRLHPRGPAPPGAAARRAAVGERHARPPDRAALRPRAAGSTGAAHARTRSASSSDFDVRTPGIDVAGVRAVRRQPAEADHRPRDGGDPRC